MKITAAFIIVLYVLLTNCEGENEEVMDLFGSRGEYGNAFRTVPTLFEYILNMLIEHPEILERNDITIFTNDSTHEDETFLDPENSTCCPKTDNSFETVNFEDNTDTSNIRKSESFVAPMISAFQLTPEEVMEQVLIIEQQLDKYNSKKSK
ncbi:unnamed protein product, partial [Brenthis ino]